MKATPKEILNNKSNKMVDLILDEIRDGGSKTITAGFTDHKKDKNYILTVGITVADVEKEDILEDVCANCSCNCMNHNNTPSETPTTDPETPVTDPETPTTDPETPTDSNTTPTEPESP